MRALLLLVCAVLGLSAVEPAVLERMARAVENLPAQHEGRIKPLASVARHAVLSLSGRSQIAIEDGYLSATAWLVESLVDREGASARRVVRLRNPEVGEALGLAERPKLRYSIAEIISGFMSHQQQLSALFHRDRNDLKPAESQLMELESNLSQVMDSVFGNGLAVIPGPANAREHWLAPGAVRNPDAEQAAALAAWSGILTAIRASDAAAVERAAADMTKATASATEPTRLHAEVTYHRLDLFTYSLSAYVICLILLGIGLLAPGRWPWRLAMAAMAAGVVCHLTGICLRMWIMQRPPVATLYESVLFVGAVSALLGLVIEAYRRRGDGAFIGATLAAVLQLISLSYADDGDTMGMLVAVLNSNFWLTIHVLTITAGYGCTLVAGLAGHVALAARWAKPLDHATHEQHNRAMLGLSLVALLFTLFGTILGGIWADQSWGRFWGWDPKENGALLIVLWLLLMMHLRTSSLAGPRGFALGLILGNIVVAVAWFGVNLLNVGLHSYGFTSGIFWSLCGFAAFEVLAGAVLWAGATLSQQPPAKTDPA